MAFLLGVYVCASGKWAQEFQASQMAVRKQWACGHKVLSLGPGPRVLAIRELHKCTEFTATATRPELSAVPRAAAHLIHTCFPTEAHRPHFWRFRKLGYYGMRKQEGSAGLSGIGTCFRPPWTPTPEVSGHLMLPVSIRRQHLPLAPPSLHLRDRPTAHPTSRIQLPPSPPPTGGHLLHPMNLPPAFSFPLLIPSHPFPSFQTPHFCLSLAPSQPSR